MNNKNSGDSDKPADLLKIKGIPKIKVESPFITSDGEVERGPILEPLWKSLEPLGNPSEKFAMLIRAAYSFVDPYAHDLPGHLGEAALVSLAKENNGQNNAYTDLQEMLEQFERALGK